MKKTGFIIAVFLSLALVSSGQETFTLPVRAVSDSFISLHISVKGTPGTVIASGSSKGYIEAELEIPCSAGEKKTLEYYYHITRAGEWAGRGKGSVDVLLDTDEFPERLLVVSQKEKDVSSHRLFLFSLNKRFFKGGEKGYLIIQSADAVTTSLPSDKFNLTLKDVFPFSPDSPDIELQTVREQEGLYSFNIPVIPNSVYRLKIVDAANNGEAPLGDFLIGLRTFDPNISIFTDRNRTVFLQGEKVEVNLYLAGSGQFEGKINLAVDGKILTEQAVSFSKEKTVSFLLDTSDFSHGTHILKATLSNNAEATYPMEIVSSVLASHLVRLDYLFFASLLQPVSNGLSPAAIAQQAGLYVDAVTEGGSSYEIGDILFDKRENIFSKEDRYRDIKGFIEEHPLYLPKERTYNPIKTYHLLEEILKNRASYFLRPSFIRYLAHSIPEDENRRYRHVQLLAQTFRNYPSFAGLNYHDDTYALGYGETGWMDGRRAERMKALKQDFEKETGKKPEQDRKGWIDFINRLFPSVYERYQKGLKEVDKNYLGTSQLVPDAGAADGFYIPLVYRNLDAVTYLSYSDHVGFPLQEAFQGALYKAGLRDKPVYSTQNGHMPTSLRFEAMMQASTLCEGMGFMDINGKLGPYAIKDNWVLGNGGDHYRIPDGMRIAGRTVAELYKRYGDFFLKLNRGEQTAILFSYTQAASERTGSATDHKYTVFEAYSSLARSHIPADIITEEEISSGGFERYKVIVLAGLKVELPERVKTRLKEFQKQGGVIFADSECSFQVNSVKTLPVAFSSYGIHWGGFDGNLEYRLFYDVAVKKSPAIREAIGPFIEEMFTCENPRVFLFHRKAGSSHYLFTFHDTPPAFDWGLPFDADAEEIWKDSKLRNEYRAYSNKYSGSDRLYQNWMIPTVKEIRLKGLEGYTVYDVLEGKKIDVKDSVLNADFRRFEGRIYAFLPDEIAGVNLSVSGSLDCGVNLTGKSGKEIEEPVPVEVTITDREDNVVYHIFRASPFSERLPVQKFLLQRIENVAHEIGHTVVEKGVMIWKLYNHGFVVRTNSVTIAFDMIRPSTRFENFVSDTKTEIGHIIRECDALFVSHWHDDHADPWVAQAFIDQGKPVVSPPDVWREEPFYEKVNHLARDGNKVHILPIQKGKQELKVVIYPGHQGDYLNNIPVVYTPDGFCLSHNGDQNYGNMAQDTIWLFNIKDHHRINVLMYNSYMSSDWISGFNPELVITGHENELGHGIHSRHPYWEMHQRLKSVPYSFVVMAWGEKYHYFSKKLL